MSAGQHDPSPRVRSLAFYLPQFHPVAENDEWWGPGFTEWTNVARTRPMFPGHYQPRIPGELGFYDLRLDETRAAQAELASAHGITGFCYWHYWFAGRRMLDHVVEGVVRSGIPDFPFCLGWANETWGGHWVGAPRATLIEQTYPGDDDHRRHFDALVATFHDPRYFRVHDRPLFFVYRPQQLPDAAAFAALWRRLADDAGLPGLFLVGQTGTRPTSWRANEHGFDACAPWRRFPRAPRVDENAGKWHGDRLLTWLSYRLPFVPKVYAYRSSSRYLPVLSEHELSFPSVLPGWDNTRARRDGSLYHGATPDAFAEQVEVAVQLVQDHAVDERLVFIRSWNEWAEGNALEPDRRYGRAFLEAFRDAVMRPAG